MTSTIASTTFGKAIAANADKDSSAYKGYSDLSDKYKGYGDALIAIAAFAFDPTNFSSEALEPLISEAAKVKGRSASGTSTKEAPVAGTFVSEDKTFARPNGDLYYSRKWGTHDDILVLREARKEGMFIFLYGAPGCGKTALAEGAFGDDLITVMGSGDTEVSDLVGAFTTNPKGGFFWEDGPLIKAAEAGKPLMIDEIGLIDPKVLSIVYGLMDGRREYTVTANPDRGTVKAKEGFYVIAATNPNAPGVRLSEALLSRFGVHVEMTTDWVLAKKLGVPSSVVAAAQNLSKKMGEGETSWAPQFRELLAFRDVSAKFGTKFAIQNLLASAPEIDRATVADVLTKTYGETCTPAVI